MGKRRPRLLLQLGFHRRAVARIERSQTEAPELSESSVQQIPDDRHLHVTMEHRCRQRYCLFSQAPESLPADKATHPQFMLRGCGSKVLCGPTASLTRETSEIQAFLREERSKDTPAHGCIICSVLRPPSVGAFDPRAARTRNSRHKCTPSLGRQIAQPEIPEINSEETCRSRGPPCTRSRRHPSWWRSTMLAQDRSGASCHSKVY